MTRSSVSVLLLLFLSAQLACLSFGQITVSENFTYVTIEVPSGHYPDLEVTLSASNGEQLPIYMVKEWYARQYVEKYDTQWSKVNSASNGSLAISLRTPFFGFDSYFFFRFM